jgi:hypothetical protein
MAREAFYVAMTRGRHSNTTYVVTEHADPQVEEHLHPDGVDPQSALQVLRDVLSTEGTERSASEQIRRRVLQRGARHTQTDAPVLGHRRAPECTLSAHGKGIER